MEIFRFSYLEIRKVFFSKSGKRKAETFQSLDSLQFTFESFRKLLKTAF